MKISKRIAALVLSFTALVAVVPVANALTASNNFTVTATLSSACQVSNNLTQTINFGTYTAFQASAITPAAISLIFNCTHNYPPISVAFDAVNGSAAGLGVLNGVAYSLTAAAPTTAAGANATTTVAAGQDVVTYAVTGTMAAAQPGQCATASCGPTSHTRTLILTY